ncbi:hypothetical protein ACFVTE_21575 [Arthrobacter sp. NPDC058097]|uniref:hypothetical protein n=1 Tax=Arthrobacter sp. NPDC058097 TaxID=3346340 RepID=UPI0036DDC23F
MTENQWPQDENLTAPPATQNSGYGAGTTGYGATGAGTTGYGAAGYQDDASSKKDVAKEEAANVAGEAKGAAQNVAETAKTEAKNVAYEAKNSARDLLHQAKSDLTSQAGTQQTKAAEGIRNISSQLRTMADAPDQQGVAADLIRQAADRSASVASWLDNRDPGSLLDEVKSFARQRPGTFLLLAAGAGLLAGRLGRSLQAGAPETGTAAGYGSTGGTLPQYPAQPPVTEGSLDAGVGAPLYDRAELGEPAYTQPAYGETTYGEQATGQPAYGQPSTGQPAYGEQTYGEQPAYGEPATGQPAYGEQTYGEQPAYGEPGTGQPAYGEQTYGEQPAYGEQTYGEQPAYGEPGVGEPGPGEPGYGEPRRRDTDDTEGGGRPL